MFIATDVAKVLGYERLQNAISMHCESADYLNYSKIFIPHQNGVGGSKAVLISESNVCRLPEAEKFKKWVFEDVLPSIFRTGGYIPVSEGESSAGILAKALVIARETIVERDRLISRQTRILQENKPKVEFYNDFIEKRDWFKTSTIADELRTNTRELHNFLHQKGIIHQNEQKLWEANRAYRSYQTRVYYEYHNPKANKMYKYGTRLCRTHAGRKAILELWKQHHT